MVQNGVLNTSLSNLILTSSFSHSPLFSGSHSFLNLQKSSFSKFCQSISAQVYKLHVKETFFSHILNGVITYDGTVNYKNQEITSSIIHQKDEGNIKCEKCYFKSCVSQHSGACVLFANDYEYTLSIFSCYMENCFSSGNGGVVSAKNFYAFYSYSNCIVDCASKLDGQAFDFDDSTYEVEVNHSTFIRVGSKSKDIQENPQSIIRNTKARQAICVVLNFTHSELKPYGFSSSVAVMQSTYRLFFTNCWVNNVSDCAILDYDIFPETSSHTSISKNTFIGCKATEASFLIPKGGPFS